MKLDPEEIEVWCVDCSCKLFNSSIYDHPTGQMNCPDRERCTEEAETERWIRAGCPMFPLYH